MEPGDAFDRLDHLLVLILIWLHPIYLLEMYLQFLSQRGIDVERVVTMNSSLSINLNFRFLAA